MQQLADDGANTHHLIVDEIQFGPHLLCLLWAQGHADHIHIALDYRYRVVDLMGDPGGDFSDRGELFTHHQLLKCLFQFLVRRAQFDSAPIYPLVQLPCPIAQALVTLLNLVQKTVEMPCHLANFILPPGAAIARCQVATFHPLHGQAHPFQGRKDPLGQP